MSSDTPSLEREMLQRADGAEAPPWLEGRGIVTCAGGARMFTNVYVLVRVLRESLHCTLPIQIWSFGASELTPVMRRLLGRFDVELVDAPAVLKAHPSPISSGWQLKSYAILYSRFRDVLFLDADQVPVRDPAPLFEESAFRENGAVFWPDSIDIRADNPIWAELGLTGADVPSWESGQVLVDTMRHWKALSAVHFLNERREQVYDMIYGDKDTYLVAWRRLRAVNEVVPHRPFRDARVTIQRDFSGAPLFQHRSNAKWIYGGRQYDFEGSVHTQDCQRYLRELTACWNGRVFYPPDRPLAARQEEERLEGMQAKLEVIGDHSVDIAFLACHELGRGRNFDRQNWYVDGEEPRLVLTDGTRETFCFRKVSEHGWEGEATGAAVSKVRLTETDGGGGSGLPAGHGLVESVIQASGIRNPAFHADQSARQELISALRLLLAAEPGLRAAIDQALGRLDIGGDIAGEVLDDEPVDPAPHRDHELLSRQYRERPLRT